MQVDLIEKHADFLFDKEGVIIVTDIEKDNFVTMSELIYDGKNVAILNRNNRDFFMLKNITPMLRDKIKQSSDVTIVEKDKGNIYSYKVKVHLKDDLGFEDDFDAYAKKVMSELKEKMTPEQFEKLANESAKIIKEFEN